MEAQSVVLEMLPTEYNMLDLLPEMIGKLRFYEKHGAQEFYVIDPDHELLQVWIRGDGDGLSLIETNGSFTSPILGITFVLKDGLSVVHKDGSPFLTFAQLKEQRDALAAERDAAAAERDRLAARLRALGIDPDEV